MTIVKSVKVPRNRRAGYPPQSWFPGAGRLSVHDPFASGDQGRVTARAELNDITSF